MYLYFSYKNIKDEKKEGEIKDDKKEISTEDTNNVLLNELRLSR